MINPWAPFHKGLRLIIQFISIIATIEINRSSMANRVSRKLNRKVLFVKRGPGCVYTMTPLLCGFRNNEYFSIFWLTYLIGGNYSPSRRRKRGGGGAGGHLPAPPPQFFFQHPKSALFSKWKVPFILSEKCPFSK